MLGVGEALHDPPRDIIACAPIRCSGVIMGVGSPDWVYGVFDLDVRMLDGGVGRPWFSRVPWATFGVNRNCSSTCPARVSDVPFSTAPAASSVVDGRASRFLASLVLGLSLLAQVGSGSGESDCVTWVSSWYMVRD